MATPSNKLSAALNQCRRCELWRNATQAVGGAGPSHATIMLVGEQPGDQEDIAGQPFVGPAGQVLARALHEAGLERAKVYITNAVKHFKFEMRGKRRMHKTPAQREIDACYAWLEQELASVAPTVVVALGATALKALLHDSDASLAPMLGKAFHHDGRWVVASYHPSYVLRVPGEGAKARAFDVLVDAFARARALTEAP